MNKKNVKPNLLTIKLLIVSVILATLTGCGSNTASEETEVNVAKATSKIAFSWWGNDPRHLYTMEGVDLFEIINIQHNKCSLLIFSLINKSPHLIFISSS